MRLRNRKYTYNRYISEAIPYSDVKKYLKIDRSKDVQKRLDIIFNKLSKLKNATTSKRGDRVYIPFDIGKRTSKSNIQLEIEELLIDNGMELLDYSKGLALDTYGRKTKIGKLLRRLDKNLLQPFANDASRVSDKIINSYIVFSKHKYDIVGMSTDRNWTSCMDIYNDKYAKYTEFRQRDISVGTFIAYLVSSNDMNINNPVGRVLLKPFINSKNDEFVYIPDTVYDSGNIPTDFMEQVKLTLSKVQNISYGIFNLPKNTYCDIVGRTFHNMPTVYDSVDAIDFLFDTMFIKKYKVNRDLSVDVFEDIYFDENDMKGFDHLPIRFNSATSVFSIDNCGFKSLKNCPSIIGGDFHISRNNLTNLIGSPNIIKGDFWCDHSNLKSLTGAPKVVEGDMYLRANAREFTKNDIVRHTEVAGKIYV